jgi:hypothetical protein
LEIIVLGFSKISDLGCLTIFSVFGFIFIVIS